MSIISDYGFILKLQTDPYWFEVSMSKKELLKQELAFIINEDEKLENFLLKNSNLPGRRANIELAFALAELFSNSEKIVEWSRIDERKAGVNEPLSFLPFCSAVCLGNLYVKEKSKYFIDILQQLANDNRWRIREAVAFGFQYIGENNFLELVEIFRTWMKTANNYEKRAILVALAHPPMLTTENSLICFDFLEQIMNSLNNEKGAEILLKGLQFVISVYIVFNPDYGFEFVKKSTNKSKTINKILKSNLKKKRVVNLNPKRTKELLRSIN